MYMYPFRFKGSLGIKERSNRPDNTTPLSYLVNKRGRPMFPFPFWYCCTPPPRCCVFFFFSHLLGLLAAGLRHHECIMYYVYTKYIIQSTVVYIPRCVFEGVGRFVEVRDTCQCATFRFGLYGGTAAALILIINSFVDLTSRSMPQ